MIFPSLVLSSQDMFLIHTLPTHHTQFSIFNGNSTGVFLVGRYGSLLVGEEKIQ